ncbi:MAG: phosphoenolpyruvate--protein phosphotransferase [Rhodospirillaceae bacterium]|nr:phosphoenolpyruvate--protein phosphotransferase [Rhodospirillaceae bacterium]OUT76108.1 MAG: phosphoenolpyruvate--protein phosphotransferase [Rhodospirillaceae bacterium TMED23]|tara:strand:- start:37054 stop:39327 length:2274 start_codon:yes stop_codon:yes gene_type:complete
MPRIKPLTGSRLLLARLRDIMASNDVTQQARLDKIVSIIANDFVAEVCSIYVLRAGEVLELFAATGLAPEAIHSTRLAIGEGLIGRIASKSRPLALSDAQGHPYFSYRPETGEEIFQSLVGVPILRGGRVTGVLAVQNQTSRSYTEEEIEILETTAMVIAELIASDELLGKDELRATDGSTLMPITLDGIRLNGGLAIGKAIFHERAIPMIKLVSDDPAKEQQRLDKAVIEMHGAIDQMIDDSEISDGGDHKDILKAYRMFAEDVGWLSRITEAIDNGLTAEAAVEKVRNDTRARFRKQTNRYLRERMHDFDDLAHRLLQHLVGKIDNNIHNNLNNDTILLARNMGPAELLDYDRKYIKGLVLEGGSSTTHLAIVARALDIPVVGKLEDALDKIEPLETIIIDGDNGQIHIRPSQITLQSFTNALKSKNEQLAIFASLRDIPAITEDNIMISLNINAGLLTDIDNLLETGADGIGLFRTEIPFMDNNQFPNVDRQTDLYRQIIQHSEGKEIIFRTLDIGGDKNLPYWNTYKEENPSMGWRAIRISLDKPVILRHQLRALVRATEGQNLNVMFPMITEITEFYAAKNILQLEIDRAEAKGRKPLKNLKVGVMLEVPALAYQMTALLEHSDFISVGSNDLFQFLFASDRSNPRIADRYGPLSMTGINFLTHIVKQCKLSDTPLSICGEIAGRPLDAMALIGIGFRNLSMQASSIGPVKAMTRSLSVNKLEQYLMSLQDHPSHNVREKLREFAIDHNVIF